MREPAADPTAEMPLPSGRLAAAARPRDNRRSGERARGAPAALAAARPDDDATLLLRRLSDGDASAGDELLPLVYAELRGAAERAMGRERAEHTLQPTALVHEAWLKLVDPSVAWRDRRHFVSVAARAMRQVLVDHARARATAKRGSARERVPLTDVLERAEGPELDLVALDEALGRLGERDPELARLVELRYFGGLTVQEAAEVLGVSHRRIERGWSVARGFLHGELADGPSGESGAGSGGGDAR